ncbi:MAG: formate dehydrogenase accessory sulfurtransferase FdhD [Gemmatimonadota bacterium]
MRKKSTTRRRIEQVVAGGDDGAPERRSRRDTLATEEPLEIRIVRAEDRARIVPRGAARSAAAAIAGDSATAADGVPTRLADVAHRVSVTMRTPGHDFELAAGFLYGESLIDDGDAIDAMRFCVDPAVDGAQRYNIVNVMLAPGTAFDPASLRRNFYTTSSCGVCGKASIEAVRDAGCPVVRGDAAVTVETLLSLPASLRAEQAVFDRTGGLHAAALFSPGGELLEAREDVGRHNAMDKLVGAMLLAGELPLADRIVMVSGRLSFELVQKAARAGVTALAGVSAPSSLAVELADDVGMTLVGFLRDGRFNVYTGGDRVVTDPEAGRRRGRRRGRQRRHPPRRPSPRPRPAR